MSASTMCAGMLPQPIPASSRVCLVLRSDSRQVRLATTPNSWSCDSGERSVMTSWTCSRAAPGTRPSAPARGWFGAATGSISTSPTAISSSGSLSRVHNSTVIPRSARPSVTNCWAAPSASTLRRRDTVGKAAWNAVRASTSRAPGISTLDTKPSSASRPPSRPLTLARRVSMPWATVRASASTARPPSVSWGRRVASRSNRGRPS